jgi:hypothetical protein
MDAANARDPNTETVAGQPQPRELLYAERLTAWVLKLNPNASEELRLAARSQHICRWEIPRHRYPFDRAGYLRWRAELKKFHAEKSGAILRECGYPEHTVQRVQELNLKLNFPHDPETQLLEDALCLVFLEYQFGDLAARTTAGKMISALQKTWAKMSTTARERARELTYTEMEQRLLASALNSGTPPAGQAPATGSASVGTNLPPQPD